MSASPRRAGQRARYPRKAFWGCAAPGAAGRTFEGHAGLALVGGAVDVVHHLLGKAVHQAALRTARCAVARLGCGRSGGQPAGPGAHCARGSARHGAGGGVDARCGCGSAPAPRRHVAQRTSRAETLVAVSARLCRARRERAAGPRQTLQPRRGAAARRGGEGRARRRTALRKGRAAPRPPPARSQRRAADARGARAPNLRPLAARTSSGSRKARAAQAGPPTAFATCIASSAPASPFRSICAHSRILQRYGHRHRSRGPRFHRCEPARTSQHRSSATRRYRRRLHAA